MKSSLGEHQFHCQIHLKEPFFFLLHRQKNKYAYDQESKVVLPARFVYTGMLYLEKYRFALTAE